MELIRTLFSLRETKLATEVLEALEKHAWQFAEYDSLAQVWFKVKKYNDAIRNGEKALHIAYTNEQMWAARSNLINLYNHANFPEKAMSLIKMNEYVIPEDHDTKMEKAFSHFLLGERDEAEEILLKELENINNELSLR